ncbi:uncharacterized protein LOC113002671 [Solenopsis invicta]|uniref:uncharacterized protein LOC113002671 n=1 Tax=Solenopsis invicta TaxID=13686 RepID=UPI00193EB4DE|nr:uncharacterized protein LOC113002671 [Solenopsis invicta]XP_039310376.1 uncharacterized protein LOC113002671 [Solenopsis invicta]XP_039310377.1 uncharacterized protein LOC113002671 [Solenopsis invicta]
MDPPSPQTILKKTPVAKDFMARLESDENRELQDISNFTRNFRNNNNEEILSPKRKKYKMQATSSPKNYENVLNKDSEIEEEENVNILISTLKSILFEIKDLKKGQEKILEVINQFGNAKSTSTAVIKEVQKLNLPLQTVEQFHSLMNDEKALTILEKYFVRRVQHIKCLGWFFKSKRDRQINKVIFHVERGR